MKNFGREDQYRIADPLRDSLVPENNGLSICDILDKAGDWCGAIALDGDWIKDKDGQLFYFIALSDAKSFTLEEFPAWTYYIPKEREKSEWDLYFILLVERNYERGLWEQVGLGKVFQAAFREQSWDEVKLGCNLQMEIGLGIGNLQEVATATVFRRDLQMKGLDLRVRFNLNGNILGHILGNNSQRREFLHQV
ncbi:hypothetical protein F53441_648 [Fusarium austroafricanum]|uniref:Uncharacterized protein n=1 Tax=Fusarium austroafricanum TaxID=2364996 RepID=A0A8H4KWC0_9HYPO|nr:hypothetical protein F53441_648 [Fusarium austroafricanum]